ncbi:hypothetical protein KIW84_060422 [Lathyrus oleraceus]|nr:hypothetical protein KIW84_060422 [Pisum sativum]
MAKILRTEQTWKTELMVSSKHETDEDLLKYAISNVMEALQRNIESKRLSSKDKILMNIFMMNTYWYMYMRTKNTELGDLLGEKYIKENYKAVAEESAYLYQKQAWLVLVKILDHDINLEEKRSGRLVNEKIETFFKCLSEICERHRSFYSIPDVDLREQMRDATVKLVVPIYAEFLESYSGFLQRKAYPSPQRMQGLLGKAFGSNIDWNLNGGRNSGSLETDIRRSR